MDGDNSPQLEIGFAIETAGSFAELQRLQQAMGSTEASVVADAARIEKATAGMVNTGAATAQVVAFGNAHTRAEQEIRAARASSEKSGEAMVRQLQRQIETYGKTSAEIRTMRAEQRALAAESSGLTELAGRIRALDGEMRRLEGGTSRVSRAANDNRMAIQGASYQVQDFFTQVSMGANPINAFAVQGAQLAGQFSNIEGKAGNVARFFMGPWGLAITAGAMLLGPFVSKIFEGNNALDKAVEKLKEDAKETEINRRAKQLFIQTEEGVRKAILDTVAAHDKWIESQRTAIEQAAILARAQELAAQKALAATERQLAGARERLKGFTGPAGSDPRLMPARQAIEAEIATLEKLQKAQTEAVVALGLRTRETFVDLISEATKKSIDPIESIRQRYEGSNGLIAQTKQRLVNEKATSEEMGRQLRLLHEKQQAEIAEAQRQQSALRGAANDNRQIGRQISLSEAEGIVRSIGGVITSTTRSFEQQRVLYERYLAGKGPLAAKPGTSDHEVGNAIDIAKTPGMSLAKIRDAFRAAGVPIKQLLDEGRHFHVSWKKGADDAAAASKNLADAQAALAKQFDPAEAAAIEYRDALAKIAAAKLDPSEATRYADAARDAFIKARAAAFQLPSMEEIRAQAADAEASEKAAAEFHAHVIQPLRDEIALWGLVGPARAAAALELEKNAFIARNMDQGVEVATARWQEYYRIKTELIEKDAAAEQEAERIRRVREEMDWLIDAANRAGDGLAEAFGRGGSALSDMLETFVRYSAEKKKLDEAVEKEAIGAAAAEQKRAMMQVGLYGDMLLAARGFFAEGSSGYKALTKALQIFRAIEFALSVRAMAQDAVETAKAVVNSAIRVAKFAIEGIAAQAKLPFPLNIAAMAATGAALAAIGAGVAGAIGGGGKNDLEPSNNGTGTVFGDPKAQSQSIKRAIDQLKEVDTIMLSYSREMAASLRSIDSQIGGFAAVILRSGDVNASEGVAQGFKPNAIGSILGAIPLVGGLLKSLFGTTTTVIGSGLFGGPQSIASILAGGFDASTYSDIERKSKFLGITTSKKYSTQYGAADPALENQFTLILRSFYDAISAAAGPLGVATSEIQQRLNSFVVNIGKIDLKGLSGEQIADKLSAIFGAAADQMAAAAFPGFERFQRAGEGMFETLVRVASTVETVTASLDQLGLGSRALSIDAKLGLADQFESLSALASATDNYFKAYYTREEQAAASAAQFSKVFQSLGLSMPTSLSAFRALVEAQDLTTAAGQATYATLLQLAPAFADLQNALAGAKSAADVIAERQDLERRLLELQGNTAALRALDLAKLDASNRALQQQIWAIQDAQEAARAAEELRKAWTSVGDSIMDEVRRIRGLTGAGGEGSFASLQGQFNAAAAAARGGDIEAAKSLPGLSQAMLAAAEKAATSRQELDRIRAQTAAALEAVFATINGANPASGATPTEALLQNMADAVSLATASANDDTVQEIRTGLAGLREEVAQMRAENNTGHAATAGNTGSIKRTLDNVTADSGGDAISTRAA